MKTEKQIFVEEYIQEIGCYMYEYEDSYDYSKGMDRIDDERIKEIAEGFFDDIFINMKELRKLKLRKIERI